ncbi:hypothetical protein QF038_000838 [Pseudarthrobacter sp. W1I19]|nr:hypothetical protein [Pseudarthrobacter sp. W1I19]
MSILSTNSGVNKLLPPSSIGRVHSLLSVKKGVIGGKQLYLRVGASYLEGAPRAGLPVVGLTVVVTGAGVADPELADGVGDGDGDGEVVDGDGAGPDMDPVVGGKVALPVAAPATGSGTEIPFLTDPSWASGSATDTSRFASRTLVVVHSPRTTHALPGFKIPVQPLKMTRNAVLFRPTSGTLTSESVPLVTSIDSTVPATATGLVCAAWTIQVSSPIRTRFSTTGCESSVLVSRAPPDGPVQEDRTATPRRQAMHISIAECLNSQPPGTNSTRYSGFSSRMIATPFSRRQPSGRRKNLSALLVTNFSPVYLK